MGGNPECSRPFDIKSKKIHYLLLQWYKIPPWRGVDTLEDDYEISSICRLSQSTTTVIKVFLATTSTGRLRSIIPDATSKIIVFRNRLLVLTVIPFIVHRPPPFQPLLLVQSSRNSITASKDKWATKARTTTSEFYLFKACRHIVPW